MTAILVMSTTPVFADDTNLTNDVEKEPIVIEKGMDQDSTKEEAAAIDELYGLIDEELAEAVKADPLMRSLDFLEGDLAKDKELALDDSMIKSETVEQLDISPDAEIINVWPMPEKEQIVPDKATGLATDVVEIDGDNYAVLTPEGIGIAYQKASDSVVVLTQDYVQQADAFAEFYENPIAAVANFIEYDCHLNIYDKDTGTDIYVTVSEGDWQQYYPDSENLTDAEVQSIMMYLESCGLAEASAKTYGLAGGNSYFFFDCSNTDGLVFMYAAVGGYCVRVHFNASNSDEVVHGLELIDNLTVRNMN